MSTPLTPEEMVAVLAQKFEAMKTRHDFQPGQLVRWKAGLKNRELPENDQPAIVWAVLAKPVFDAAPGAGTPYFHEPLDIVLAVMDKEKDFLLYHYDSRRFEPFPK